MNVKNRTRIVLALCSAALAAGLTLKYGVPLIPHASGAVPPAAAKASEPAPVISSPLDDASPWTAVILTDAVEMSWRFEGKLAKVRVRQGDVVREGDVLAELDTKMQEQEIAAAEASLRASKAEAWGAGSAYSQAHERLKRRDGKVNVGSTSLAIVSDEEQSGARFDAASAASRAAAAQAAVQERKVRLEQLKMALAESVLRAPFDGVVATRYLDPGTRVQPSQPILRVVGRGAVRVRFAVPEDEVSSVAQGAIVEVTWDAQSFEAKVDHIAPEIESSSGTLFVEATLTDFAATEKSKTALAGRVVAVRKRVPKPKG